MPTNQLLDLTLGLFASSLKDAIDAVADIDDARLSEQPGGLVNHPAWTLGHLCSAAGFILFLLEEADPASTPQMHPNYLAKFGPGSTPTADRSHYPAKAELLESLASLHARVDAAVRAKHETYFPKPSPEKFRAFAPTVGRIVMYLLATHEPYHLGQLSQWKRAAGAVRATK
jgi:uncharacterized damage-inducible protein DinB